MLSSAPIFLKSHYFRQNIWPSIFVQFHFQDILGSLILFTHSELLRTMAENKHLGTSWPLALKQSSKYLEREKRMQISSYFKIHFHNERGLGPKSYFEGFFRAPQNLIACQISNWSDTQFRFFANGYPIFDKYVTIIFFLQYLNSCSPVRTGIIRFGLK